MVLCSRDCDNDPAARADRNCCLPDWDTNTWTGRKARLPPIGSQQPDDPAEGCPAAWQTSRFVWSLRRYMRDMDDNGNRVSNPFLDRCTDRFVIECIQALESEDRHSRAEHIDRMQKLYTVNDRR